MADGVIKVAVKVVNPAAVVVVTKVEMGVVYSPKVKIVGGFVLWRLMAVLNINSVG